MTTTPTERAQRIADADHVMGGGDLIGSGQPVAGTTDTQGVGFMTDAGSTDC